MRPLAWFCVLVVGALGSASAQVADDPTILAAVERYYKALEAEDIDAYLALWSRSAQKPQVESLKFLFDFADERYSEIEILRAVTVGDRVRVRISLRRERTGRARTPGGPPIESSHVGRAALTFVKEGVDWKVISEGSPESDLAAAYVAAQSSEEREALLAAESDLLNPLLVASVARSADQAAVLRQHARAQTLYERVLELARRIGRRKEEGEALQNIGNALYFQRKFPEALAAYQQRIGVERERGDDAAMAAAFGGVATIQYSLAEYTEALKYYRRALAIHERLDDRPSTATALISTGNVRFLQGDYQAAIRDYTQSRELARSLSDKDGDARALEGLGRTYLAQGDLAGALAAFSDVLAEGRRRGDRSRQATATRSIADVHLRLGNIEVARQNYEESRDHLVALKDTAGAGRVWQGLAMTELVAGRVEPAEQAYKTSMTLCDSAGDGECSAHAMVGLAFAQAAQEKFTDAVANYRKAIAAFSKLGEREPVARAEVGLSQALAGANELTAAIEAATRARHGAMAIDSDDIVWRALTAEARALRKSGAREQALAVARAAAGVVERMHEAALEKPATAIPSDAPAALATLAVLQSEAGDAAGASSSASRMRTIDLRNTLAVNEREIAPGLTPELREQERAEASELLSLLAQAARERGLRKPDKARLATLNERISIASSHRRESMSKLYERFPDLRIWRGLAAAPTEEEMANAVAPGTVALEFVVDDEDVLAIVTSRVPDYSVAAYSTSIRRRVLAERVHALLQAATGRDRAAWQKAALHITELFPSRLIASLAAASRIIVLPHDVLWRVPFEALPLGDGFLGERAEVVYAGSRTAAVRAAAAEIRPIDTAMAITSPELAPASKERLQQTAPGWALRPPDGATKETVAVMDAYGKEIAVVSGADATEPAVREKVAGAAALHIAAPFRINGASPLFSPVLLSGNPSSRTPEDDAALETREIMNLTVQAGIAVLSDGAAMSMRDGAAAADVVQWAWLAAGVPSVVVARWPTDQAASSALLVEFHHGLRSGKPPGEALLAARTRIRERPEWSAPFYWAGWMLMGR